jgi:hypothetical protein
MCPRAVPAGARTTWARPEDYWHGVPKRFRDPERYAVARELQLNLRPSEPEERIKVRETATGALAWTKP